MSDGAGAYSDDSALYEVDYMSTSWGAPVFDINHDGFEDIFVAAHGLNVCYQVDNSIPWSEIADQLNVQQTGLTFTATAGDIDGDGDLDLIAQYANQPMRLWVNNGGSDRPYLKVKLTSDGPNRFAVGAIIGAKTGSVLQTRMIHGSGSFKNSTPFSAHFGFESNTTTIDQLTVYWPGGGETCLYGVPVDQTITISEPSSNSLTEFTRGDTDSSGFLDLNDALENLAVLYLGVATDCLASHDVNDDAKLDLSDALYILTALFSSGAMPPAPYPNCGVDVESDFECVSYGNCNP